MNIVFFGTSEFAIPSLQALLDAGHKVLAVVTQPDRKRGQESEALAAARESPCAL